MCHPCTCEKGKTWGMCSSARSGAFGLCLLPKCLQDAAQGAQDLPSHSPCRPCTNKEGGAFFAIWILNVQGMWWQACDLWIWLPWQAGFWNSKFEYESWRFEFQNTFLIWLFIYGNLRLGFLNKEKATWRFEIWISNCFGWMFFPSLPLSLFRTFHI